MPEAREQVGRDEPDDEEPRELGHGCSMDQEHQREDDDEHEAEQEPRRRRTARARRPGRVPSRRSARSVGAGQQGATQLLTGTCMQHEVGTFGELIERQPAPNEVLAQRADGSLSLTVAGQNHGGIVTAAADRGQARTPHWITAGPNHVLVQIARCRRRRLFLFGRGPGTGHPRRSRRSSFSRGSARRLRGGYWQLGREDVGLRGAPSRRGFVPEAPLRERKAFRAGDTTQEEVTHDRGSHGGVVRCERPRAAVAGERARCDL